MTSCGPPCDAAVRERHALSIGGFEISREIETCELLLPPHAHSRGRIRIPLEGAFEERVGERVHRCDPGVAILRGPGVVHENRMDRAVIRSILVEMPPERYARCISQSFPALDAISVPGSAVEDIPQRIAGELERGDAASPVSLEGLVLHLLAAASRIAALRSGARPWAVVEAVRRIESAQGRAVSLSSLANELGVSTTRLAREFRRDQGRSVGDVIRERRVAAAADALLTTSLSAGAIAAECGFSDQAHMAREFKRLRGVSPAEYRGLSER